MIRSQLLQINLRHAIAALALTLLAMIGCGKPELPVEYGKRQGSTTGQSVSGTAALGKLFEQHGSSIHAAGKLSDRLERAQVLVWTPDSFKGPSSPERKFLEKWLYNNGNGGRTLIYVGRDFDPAERYWELISAGSKSSESF